MNELDPGLQAIIDRIGLTPTEYLRDEFWWEREEFDLHVKHTVSGHYQGQIYIDIDRYLEVTCRDPRLLSGLLDAALPKGTQP